MLVACGNDKALVKRIAPYHALIRKDVWGYPQIYRAGSFMVTGGSERRQTGTHYTPKSLTEQIVTETLEPLVYVGPAEGKPREPGSCGRLQNSSISRSATWRWAPARSSSRSAGSSPSASSKRGRRPSARVLRSRPTAKSSRRPPGTICCPRTARNG